MTKEEFKSLNLEEVCVIDLREDTELAILPSPVGAVHLPTAKMIDHVKNGVFPKDKKIVTVCASGERCQMVNELLIANGYQADYLEGGINSFN